MPAVVEDMVEAEAEEDSEMEGKSSTAPGQKLLSWDPAPTGKGALAEGS